jgi:hypothetical protein
LCRELHAGQHGAGFGGHQISVAARRRCAQDALAKCAAAGRQDHSTGADSPRPVTLAIDPGGAGDGVPVAEQLQRRVVIQNDGAGRQHAAAHEVHVVGSAQEGAVAPLVPCRPARRGRPLRPPRPPPRRPLVRHRSPARPPGRRAHPEPGGSRFPRSACGAVARSSQESPGGRIAGHDRPPGRRQL